MATFTALGYKRSDMRSPFYVGEAHETFDGALSELSKFTNTDAIALFIEVSDSTYRAAIDPLLVARNDAPLIL